jgi:hypothetical protein
MEGNRHWWPCQNENTYPGEAAILAERLANMDNIARQEDTWGALEDVEVHGWSDADSDV